MLSFTSERWVTVTTLISEWKRLNKGSPDSFITQRRISFEKSAELNQNVSSALQPNWYDYREDTQWNTNRKSASGFFNRPDKRYVQHHPSFRRDQIFPSSSKDGRIERTWQGEIKKRKPPCPVLGCCGPERNLDPDSRLGGSSGQQRSLVTVDWTPRKWRKNWFRRGKIRFAINPSRV